DVRVWAGAHGEVALIVVEQPALERAVDRGSCRGGAHWPIRCARALKKMPLGASASSAATGANVAVSYTSTRPSSRADSQTTSPRGANSMCSTAFPGFKVFT